MEEEGKRLGRILAGSVFFLFLGFCRGGSLEAQDDPVVPEIRDRGTVGVFLGRTSSRQLWNNSFASEHLQGIGLGAYVDVRTPIPFVSVRAEAGYAGRGTLVWDDGADPERNAEARIRSHYLSMPVHGKVTMGAGPLAAFFFAGPTLDFLLSSRCSEEFCQAIREEKTTVFSVAAGGGLGLELGSSFRTEVEFRVTEGLSDAYLGNQDSARNRSAELLVRVGKAL